jgi:hypothetical protein
MTLDDNPVKAVDRISKKLHTSRSAFTRKAFQDALVRYHLDKLGQKHRQGYEQHPVSTDEFWVWETEQVWGSEAAASEEKLICGLTVNFKKTRSSGLPRCRFWMP